MAYTDSAAVRGIFIAVLVAIFIDVFFVIFSRSSVVAFVLAIIFTVLVTAGIIYLLVRYFQYKNKNREGSTA